MRKTTPFALLLLALAACRTAPSEPAPAPDATRGVPVGASVEARGATWATWAPQVERVLGEVPHVAQAHWDWRRQTAWFRFVEGERADAAALRQAIDERTMFSSGEVRWLYSLEELPRELR